VQPDRDRGFNPFFGLDMDDRLQVFLAVDVLVDISDAVELRRIVDERATEMDRARY
jgi:hypothetical protein